MKRTIACKGCNKKFNTNLKHQKFCSKLCYNIDFKEQFTFKADLPKSTKGTISELFICNDLLLKGYEVFLHVAPNSQFDIIASKNNKLLKIEATTGNLIYNRKNFDTQKLRKNISDIVAVYFGNFIDYYDSDGFLVDIESYLK